MVERAFRFLTYVMPAKAGTQTCFYFLVSRLRGNDEEVIRPNSKRSRAGSSRPVGTGPTGIWEAVSNTIPKRRVGQCFCYRSDDVRSTSGTRLASAGSFRSMPICSLSGLCN